MAAAAVAPVVGGASAARAEMAEAKFMVEICFSFGKSSLCDWKVLYWSMGTTFCTLEEFKNVKDFRYTVNVKFRFKSLLDKDTLIVFCCIAQCSRMRIFKIWTSCLFLKNSGYFK